MAASWNDWLLISHYREGVCAHLIRPHWLARQLGTTELGDDREGHRDAPAEDEREQGGIGRCLRRGGVCGHGISSVTWSDAGVPLRRARSDDGTLSSACPRRPLTPECYGGRRPDSWRALWPVRRFL